MTKADRQVSAEVLRRQTKQARTLEDWNREHHPLAEASKVWEVHANAAPKGTVRFLFTAAQNGTPVQKPVWDAILGMKDHLGAHLSVIQLRYKNPTSKWSRSQEDRESWDPDVMPYALNQRMDINKNLVCTGQVKIVPTASDPLSGFEAFTAGASTIVGHTKYQVKTVPVPGADMAKVMTTTGACTMANYTNSRAGATGEFHHCFGVLIVELDKHGIFYMRHVNFTDDGVGIDVDQLYTSKGYRGIAPRAEAAIYGDSHVRFVDPQVDKGTFGKGGLQSALRPKRQYFHDVCDGYAVNHHHFGNPFNEAAKARSGYDDVEAEVREAVNYVAQRTSLETASYIVPDNHSDGFLHTWILKSDWKKLPVIQRDFYLQTATEMNRSAKIGKGGTEYTNPWPFWVNRVLNEVWDRTKIHVTCLTGNGEEGSRVLGIQMDLHGDRGPNGARGSRKNLRRIGRKTIIGHSHSPGVDEGCMQVGTSSRLHLEYNHNQPSGWLHTHGALHANGKRQLITLIGGKFRLPPP
jgi:hypothetical protein